MHRLRTNAPNCGFPRKLANDPTRAGQLAARKKLFGDACRYAIAPVHTRFDAIEWFVWDAELPDPLTGFPSVIRQAPTIERALDQLIASA